MDRVERREFVRKHRTCIFGYNRKNDGPAMTVVYYVLDGDDLLISTMAARAKALAVQRDPKVSLCVLDEQWPLTYLQVYGDATVEEDFDQAVDVMRRALAMPQGCETTIFAMARTAGWIAHASEQLESKTLIRPRARYVGPAPTSR